MATANELLLDAAIHRAIDTHQYSTGVSRRLIALLNRADADLMARLASALEQLPPESFTVARLEQLIYSVRGLHAAVYQNIGNSLVSEMRRLVELEAAFQLRLFQSVIPKIVQTVRPLIAVPIEQAYAAAMSRPFQGRLLSEWAGSLSEDRMRRIREAVRIGYVSNETNSQIISRIRGTRAKQYSDGIIETDRRALATIVNTAVSHTAGSARDQFYKGNADLIKAVEWVSTLDARTSELCRVRDGLHFTPDEHKPIGHSIPWLEGPGKIHWNCRSTSVPITKSWKELSGVDIPEFSPSTRASMDGQVPAEQNYGDWLQKQSAARQDEILGPTRGAAMRAGRIKWDEFYDKKGNWLTLEELAARGFRIAP